MIPVELKPEPEKFDEEVRQKGRRWLAKHGISFDAPLPTKNPKAPTYWTEYNGQLYDTYEGVCAYYVFRFPFLAGSETDHFIPKSQNAGLAYEWSNYRLACSSANKKKGNRRVLDPITELKANTFQIKFGDGAICVNGDFKECKEYYELAMKTIDVLDLNSARHKNMRICYLREYDNDPQLLKEDNPFVYYEAERQKLL